MLSQLTTHNSQLKKISHPGSRKKLISRVIEENKIFILVNRILKTISLMPNRSLHLPRCFLASKRLRIFIILAKKVSRTCILGVKNLKEGKRKREKGKVETSTLLHLYTPTHEQESRILFGNELMKAFQLSRGWKIGNSYQLPVTSYQKRNQPNFAKAPMDRESGVRQAHPEGIRSQRNLGTSNFQLPTQRKRWSSVWISEAKTFSSVKMHVGDIPISSERRVWEKHRYWRI